MKPLIGRRVEIERLGNGLCWDKIVFAVICTILSHQIVIMAAIRDFEYGGIAVDSIVLSPECRKSSGKPCFLCQNCQYIPHNKEIRVSG